MNENLPKMDDNFESWITSQIPAIKKYIERAYIFVSRIKFGTRSKILSRNRNTVRSLSLYKKKRRKETGFVQRVARSRKEKNK